MFHSLSNLQNGTKRQRQAYAAITELGVFADLAEYQPVLCGTIPLNIDVEGSDLDIIMEVADLIRYEHRLQALYGKLEAFSLKKTRIRERNVVKANFLFQDFEFELFGQHQPVFQQYAYLHMVIEEALLREEAGLREKIVRLKQKGVKTEPAFCEILGLEGDPYEALLEYGRKNGII
ncbi:protein of unknown function [Evansella caseinilytica]|uniref:DUF4269 domain-containing protein n=1 Tax=Evansella caseinilytica TaxID=1503961 RepID=A0A1H3SX87_9BACI|nr:DUF4269 domain-containing protein [Evansella caseinilytica]SDZ42636.1 protein of unknown function [Evansella caseinilytica]